MEVSWHILAILAGAAAVTFVPRVLPLMVLSRIQLPDWVLRWLTHVPIAVMAALVGQELLLSDGKLQLFPNVELPVALITCLVAIKTRSLLGTVVVGIVCMMLARIWF
jgi:branched-subunit amino acid transport protein